MDYWMDCKIRVRAFCSVFGFSLLQYVHKRPQNLPL